MNNVLHFQPGFSLEHLKKLILQMRYTIHRKNLTAQLNTKKFQGGITFESSCMNVIHEHHKTDQSKLLKKISV